MNDQSKIPMTPFDTLISTPGLRMMKLMIPYLPPSNQRMIAVYVKFMELQQTFSFFRDFRSDLHSCAFEKEVSSPSDILEELRPFLRKSDCEMIDQIQNMLNAMEMAASFQKMASETSPKQSCSDSSSGSASSPPAFDLSALLQGMLSPEQQKLFETYRDLSSDVSAADTDTNMQELPVSLENDLLEGIVYEQLDGTPNVTEDGSGKTGTDPDCCSEDKREVRQ
nr:hypothetical protein [uncultured Faecalimonas sp.]